MSNTDELCAAAQQALVAMEKYPVTVNHWKAVLLPAADALRAALAQQPAAPDRWNEGFKHGQWLAKHSAPVVERADSATPVVERSAGNVSDNAAPVAPARWYCVTNYGGATLCTGRDDAAEVAAEQDIAIPRHGPHRAVMLAEVRPARVPPGRCPTPRACEHNGKCHGKCAAPQPAPAPRLRWVEAPRRTEWGAGMMEALIALGVDETLRLYAHRDAVPMVDALLPAQPAPALVPLTDEQAESLIENSDGRWHDGEFRIDGPDLMKLLRDAAQPAPARVPLTGAEIASMQRSANTTGVQFLQPSTVRWIVRAIEAAHGITAQGEPK